MKLKICLLSLLYLFYATPFVFSEDTYFVTKEQLNNLSKQIMNLENNNLNMMSLLELQKQELENQKIELEQQTNNFQTLENSYSEKFLIMDQQLQNSQQLLNRSKNRESLYKYGMVGTFVLGLIIGIVVAK